jgi:hypothetical protein
MIVATLSPGPFKEASRTASVLLGAFSRRLIVDCEAGAPLGIAAPGKTPTEIVATLNRETNIILADPKIRFRLKIQPRRLRRLKHVVPKGGIMARPLQKTTNGKLYTRPLEIEAAEHLGKHVKHPNVIHRIQIRRDRSGAGSFLANGCEI